MEIVATIRKINENLNMIDLYNKLMGFGINSFRFNFSKAEASEANLSDFIETFNIAKGMSNSINTMLDMPYPGRKIRVNSNFTSINIVAGEKYYLCINSNNQKGDSERTLYLNAILPLKAICKGLHIVYDIGQGAFTVTNIQSDEIIELIAENSFTLYNLKSISLGYIETNEYYELLDGLCEKLQPNKVALSFVNRRNDLTEAISLKKKYGFSLISKIESEEGMKNVLEIATASDGIMFGRGDLCLNADPSHLLDYQVQVSKICHQEKCELYFATDFLTSLFHNYIPTRSDLIDLQYAVSLAPTGIILNVDLVVSDGIKRAVELIRENEKIQSQNSNSYR